MKLRFFRAVFFVAMCLCRRDARRKIVWQDRQTRRPPLAGGWSVRGAVGFIGLPSIVPGAGMMLNDTYL